MTDRKLSATYAEKANDYVSKSETETNSKHAKFYRKQGASYALASGVAYFQELVDEGLLTGKPYDGGISALVALEQAGYTIVRKRS